MQSFRVMGGARPLMHMPAVGSLVEVAENAPANTRGMRGRVIKRGPQIKVLLDDGRTFWFWLRHLRSIREGIVE